MRGLPSLLAYSVSCFLLNNVLQYHHFSACRSNLLSLFLSSGSNYCKFIEASLLALQWSPLIVAGPLLLNSTPGHPFHHAWREQEEQETTHVPGQRRG